MNRCALIDGDEVAYKGAFACQKTIYTVLDKDGKEVWTCKLKAEAIEFIDTNDELDISRRHIPLSLQLGFNKIDKLLSSILFNSKSDELRLFLSGDNNFRLSLATLTPYKGNRGSKPVNLEEMKDYIRRKGSECISFLEADDCLSASQDNIKDYETVICSSDKDLKTVPGWNYTPLSKKLIYINKDEARYNFYYQLLIGDGIDNIVSPKGLGPKTAVKILKECYENNANEIEYYKTVYKAYELYLSKGKTLWWKEDKMVIKDVIWEIANLLYMRRTLKEDERWEVPSG